MSSASTPPPHRVDSTPPSVAESLGPEVTASFEQLVQQLVASHKRIGDLAEENRQLRDDNQQLREENRRLAEENRDLRARLGKDSSNSSKSPSSDGPGAKARSRRKSKRKKSGRKPGGQPGHKGTTRHMRPPEDADEVRDRFPETCGCCGGSLAGAEESGNPVPHQQFELPPIDLMLIHFWRHRLRCPSCGETTLAELSADERTGQGPRLTAFIAMVTGMHRQSRRLTRDLIEALFGLRLSIGTIQRCWERTGQALQGPMGQLEQQLPDVDAIHLDETGWRQWGDRCWLWVATTAAFTVFWVHPKRGADMLRRWFPHGFEGTVHSDRWSAYSYFDDDKRQLCWAHLGRDLQGIIDAGGAGTERATDIRQGEHEMFKAWRQYRSGAFDRDTLQERTQPFRDAFEQFCADGEAQTEDDRWRRLGKDLRKKWDAVFRFLDVEGLEPTNNHAERAIRPAVILRKLCQGTRSDTGSVCISRIMSVLATCKQQEIDLLDFLTESIRRHCRGMPPPALLPASD